MEEIEEIDPGDEEEYWKIQDFKNYSKFYESNSKLSRIWKRGVSIGKKMVVTGAVVSSASFVLPPLVVLSAIGVAFSVPAGFVIVSYACGEKLLNTLLPMPLALPYEGNGPMYSDESGEYIVYGDDVDNGYEGDEDIQLEEDLRKGMEMRIELAEENNKEIENHEQYANEDELDKMSSKVSEIVEEWGYEPNPSAVGGLLELLPWRERVAACRPGDGLGTVPSGAFPGRRTVNSELVRTRGIRLFN